MDLTCWTRRAAVLAAGATLMVASAARAATPETSDVQAEIQALKSKVAELEAQQNQNWMTAERTAQIKAIVNDVLQDARTRGQFLDNDLSAGYNGGFFIKTDDGKFSLKANGYLQARYTFSHTEDRHDGAYSSTPASGDASGFDFRRARLIFSGTAFDPNLSWMISGDFAGGASNNNNFQTLDIYAAYKFNDLFAVRVGSFLTPYSRLEYISSGQDFTEFPAVFDPFDPVRSLGVSVYGQPIKDKLSYEVNVNNGQKSNTLGRAADIGGKDDNRLAFYGRVQFAGAGKLADFNDEADLRKGDRPFIWQLGAAAGYESANASTDAYPGPQGGTGLTGLSTMPSAGFQSYTLNGDMYRGTIDWAAKWAGWDFTAAGFIQQVNQNPGGGTSTSAYPANFFEASYYGQVGYMVVPQKWQVFARAGQLLTDGGPNRMEEYGVGTAYYFYGSNVKLQADVDYIPNEAAFSSSTQATSMNTQDILTRVQLQVKF